MASACACAIDLSFAASNRAGDADVQTDRPAGEDTERKTCSCPTIILSPIQGEDFDAASGVSPCATTGSGLAQYSASNQARRNDCDYRFQRCGQDNASKGDGRAISSHLRVCAGGRYGFAPN